MEHNDYTSPDRAMAYLANADAIPHRGEGETVLLSFVPSTAKRILDLGTGDGRLMALLLNHCKDAQCVGIDGSPTMLEAAERRFRVERRVQILSHNLEHTIPDLGSFDVVVSSFAIHHLTDERKRTLYAEVFDLLHFGGVFCNLEHVASPTASLHHRFLESMGFTSADEDKGNLLLDVESQLKWLRAIGYQDVDCYWKWLELSLFGGFRQSAKTR